MNQTEIGKFIARCRKEKKLTQAQLAEKLNITDRAVSKWETGKSMPDSSIMLELCEILGITVNELLSGEEQADMVTDSDQLHYFCMDHIFSRYHIGKKRYSRKFTVIKCFYHSLFVPAWQFYKSERGVFYRYSDGSAFNHFPVDNSCSF